jgi:hypothetical protein
MESFQREEHDISTNSPTEGNRMFRIIGSLAAGAVALFTPSLPQRPSWPLHTQ